MRWFSIDFFAALYPGNGARRLSRLAGNFSAAYYKLRLNVGLALVFTAAAALVFSRLKFQPYYTYPFKEC